VSPGCDNCYAETFDKRVGGDHWGKGAPRRTFGLKHWEEPRKWNHEASKTGKQHRVFCGSMCDIMDDEAPEGARERLWQLIFETPCLTWQLLTKRPQRYHRYLPKSFVFDNVWLGTTCEDQKFYDIRLPIVAADAMERGLKFWVSYEPALGPVTMRNLSMRPDWIIFGGESGHGRRPMEEKWARDLLAECQELNIPFFMKQFGGLTPNAGKKLIPADLLIHQFPAGEQ